MKKVVFLLVMIGGMGVECYGQNITWQWARDGISSGNINSYGEGYYVTVDSMENSYLTGFYVYTLAFDTFVLNSFPSVEAFLVKYNSTGNVLWAKSSMGPGDAYGMCIATDASNNVYLEGRYFSGAVSFDQVTLDSTGIYNIFLAKYDSSGNVIWVRTPDDSAYAYNYSVATDRFGNVYITGSFESQTITFGSHTLINTGLLSLFVVKYDSSGNVIWAKSAGGTAENISSVSIASDPSGNIYITGAFSSSTMTIGAYTLTNNGTTNSFLTKYDSAGNVLWAKSAGGTHYDYGVAVSTNSSRYVYVTGDFMSPSIIFDSDTLINIGTYNFYIAKYDLFGNVLWAKSSQDSGACFVFNLATDNNGNPCISGGQQGNPNHYPINFNNLSLIIPATILDPMFFVKFDSLGNALCGDVLPTGGDDNNGIAVGISNNVYLGGDFAMDTMIFGNDTLFRTGAETPFLAKFNLNCVEDVANPEIHNEGNISLYPNPTSGTFTLTYNSQLSLLNSQLIITDVLGRAVYHQAIINPNNTTINISQLSNGVYFYQLSNSKETLRGKFVKEN